MGGIRKGIAFGLALSLCVTSFTGCGKKKEVAAGGSKNDVATETSQIDKEHVYKQQDLDEIIRQGEKVSSIDYVGDRIKLIAQSKDLKSRCVSFKTDGSDVRSFDFAGGDKCYVMDCAFDNDGNTYIQYYDGNQADRFGFNNMVSEDAGDEAGSYFLGKYDDTGKELFKVDLAKEFADEDDNVTGLAWTEKYGLICNTPIGIQAYNEKNGFEMLLDKPDRIDISEFSYIFEFEKLANDQILSYFYDEQNACDSFEIIDLEKKDVVKNFHDVSGNDEYSFFKGADEKIYASGTDGIYKYDSDSDKLDKLLDYNSSNIDSATRWMGGIHFRAVALSDKEFLADIPLDDSDNTSFARLTKVNPEDVADKTVVTIGAMYLNSDVVSAIMKFNRNNEKYTIKINEYNELYPDDFETAEKQFDLDIISGKGSDIICVGGDAKKYADKGILLDLSSAFDKGGSLADIELLPNITEMMKIDGKIYTFMPSFSIESAVTRAKYANGKKAMTYKEVDDLIQSKSTDYGIGFGSGTVMINTKDNLVSYLFEIYKDKFIDFENRKCDFKGIEFADFLNFVNKFPAEYKVDFENWVDPESYYVEDKGVFYKTYLSSVSEYARLKQIVFGEDIELIGYPGNGDENMAAVTGDIFAVNSRTEHQDAVYDFIRSLLTAGLDNLSGDSLKERNSMSLITSGHNSLSGFSTVKNIFEAELQDAAKEKDDNDEDAYLWDSLTHKYVKMKPLSQEEIKKLYDYAASIKTLECSDSEIDNIITEESLAFFAGQKTAEEVADIIQNRVTTYLNENS